MSLGPNEIEHRAPPGATVAPPPAADRPVILFDGVCDLCHSGAAWIRARDRFDAFELLPLQAPEVARRWPALDPADLARSMHVVVPDGRVLRGSDALAFILARLPQRRWRLVGALLGAPGVRAIARPVYAAVAARRRSIPRLTACRRED